jgi:hypothetical protein
MSYIIEQTHVIYKDNKIDAVIVLWQSNPEYNWVRASYANTKPIQGYAWLKPNEILNDELIQEVAGYGMNCPMELKKVFVNYKKLKFER